MTDSTSMRIEFAPARMTKKLAAYYIGVSQRELDELRKAHHITAYGDGKRVYFFKTELDDYIASTPERDAY